MTVMVATVRVLAALLYVQLSPYCSGNQFGTVPANRECQKQEVGPWIDSSLAVTVVGAAHPGVAAESCVPAPQKQKSKGWLPPVPDSYHAKSLAPECVLLIPS